MMRRTSDIGHSAAKNFRALISESAGIHSVRIALVILIALRQPEHEVPDDIPLNFRRSRFDRVAALNANIRTPTGLRRTHRATRARVVRMDPDLHRHLLEALIQLAPEDFLDRSFRPRHAGFIDARERSQLIERITSISA